MRRHASYAGPRTGACRAVAEHPLSDRRFRRDYARAALEHTFLRNVVARSRANTYSCRDISGIGWLEVDLSDERDHAEHVVRSAPADWA